MEHFDLYLIKTQGSHRRHHDPYKQGEVFHQFTLTLVADLARMKSWSRYVIAMELSQYHPNLKRFSGVIKYGNPQKQSVFS